MCCVSVYYNVVTIVTIIYIFGAINRVRLTPDAPARMDTPDRPPTDPKRKRNAIETAPARPPCKQQAKNRRFYPRNAPRPTISPAPPPTGGKTPRKCPENVKRSENAVKNEGEMQ